MIARGEYPFLVIPKVVPGSDGAGRVVAVGKNVTRFKPGDDVVTLFSQNHLGGPMTIASMASGLGGAIHGAMREYGTWDQQGLVRMPSNLTYQEAATLPCAAMTAWNALFGLTGKSLQPGQWVLTQGTGGVSLFALQFAKNVGARVIALTSSDEKAAFLKNLGADHTINYRELPSWGQEAKKLANGLGVDQVVEVVGPKSMAQSIEAIKIDGLINIVGFVAGLDEKQPGFLDCFNHQCTVRGLIVGNRVQMEEMCRAYEASEKREMKPTIDKHVFRIDQVKEAFQFQLDGKQVGKVVIQISDGAEELPHP